MRCRERFSLSLDIIVVNIIIITLGSEMKGFIHEFIHFNLSRLSVQEIKKNYEIFFCVCVSTSEVLETS